MLISYAVMKHYSVFRMIRFIDTVVSFFHRNYSINLIEFFDKYLQTTNYPFSAPQAVIWWWKLVTMSVKYNLFNILFFMMSIDWCYLKKMKYCSSLCLFSALSYYTMHVMTHVHILMVWICVLLVRVIGKTGLSVRKRNRLW